MKLGKIKSMLLAVIVALSFISMPIYANGVNDYSFGEGSGYVYKYNCNGIQETEVVIFTNIKYVWQDDSFASGVWKDICWIGVMFLDDEHQFTIDFDMANAAELRDFLWDNGNADIWYRGGINLRHMVKP